MIQQTRTTRRLALLLFAATLALLGAAHLGHESSSHAAPSPPPLLIAAHGPDGPRRPLAVTLDRVRRQGEGYIAELDDGARAELTLEPRLQRLAERVLAEHGSPYGAAVVVSVEDGRVLAMAGRSTVEPARAAQLPLQPWAPAASVFKLVTSAALVQRGVSPRAQVCFHEGLHSVEQSNLSAHPRLDDECASFAWGLAKSQNAIIARLAHEHLDGRSLAQAAHALGFGEALPFDVAVAPSKAEIPSTGGLPFARVAAGFWQTTLSPIHGAWLAATIARHGVTPPLHVVQRIVRGRDSAVLPLPAPRRVLDESVARAVGEMMVGTTRFGTARLGFQDRAGHPFLPVSVAGKTGSLNRKPGEGPFLAYSWFVGYAPAERPEVAVAVLLGNESWRDARAHRVARELLQGFFDGERPAKGQRPALVAAR